MFVLSKPKYTVQHMKESGGALVEEVVEGLEEPVYGVERKYVTFRLRPGDNQLQELREKVFVDQHRRSRQRNRSKHNQRKHFLNKSSNRKNKRYIIFFFFPNQY